MKREISTIKRKKRESLLEAVVKLGVGAFPPNTTGKRVHKFFGSLFDVVRVIVHTLNEKFNFILGSVMIAVVLFLLGGAVWMICQITSRTPTDKTATPQSVMIRYSDDTTLEYPIENKAPKVVEVRR